jgi:signal transduction histidine kinase
MHRPTNNTSLLDVGQIPQLESMQEKLLQEYAMYKERIRVLEAELHTSQEALAKARTDALKVQTEFIANVSHEIRTPMNAIVGFAELLAETLLTDEQHRYVSSITSGVHALLGHFNDILDFAKLKSQALFLNLEPVDVSLLLREVHDAFVPQTRLKRLPIRLSIDSKLSMPLITDGVRLKQVLVYLMRNAVKFTDRGFITLSGYVVSQEMDAVAKAGTDNPADVLSTNILAHNNSSLLTPQPHELVIEITDTGIGIEQAQLEDMFQAFWQRDGSSSRRYEGKGLGLAMSKHLVELMGGTIEVKSIVGKGSNFTVRIPNLQTSLKRAAMAKESSAREASFAALQTGIQTGIQIQTHSNAGRDEHHHTEQENNHNKQPDTPHHSELAEQLRGVPMQMWSRLRHTLIFDEIERFGAMVNELGQQFASPYVEEFGATLERAARECDMKRIPALMEEFPILLQRGR